MENKHDFTTGSIFNKLIFFMLPILGALILQAMYGAADMLIVGRYGSGPGISAVSTGSNIMNLVTFLITSLATAVTILQGRYLGEGKKERISRLIGGAVAFFLIFSIVLSVALVLFARPVAILMQAPPEALDLTVQYIRICGAGFIFIAFYNLISSIFRGIGDSNTPLLFVAIACVINIVGDYVLVAIFHMDVAGAAIATVAAQAVSVLLSLVIIRKRDLPFSVSPKNIHINEETWRFIKIGTPLAFQEIMTNFSFLALCAFINNLGLAASNGYGIAQKIQSFIMLIPVAIIQGMATFVAQNVGAGLEDRAKKGMLYGIAIGVSVGIVIAGLTFIKGDVLATFFSDDPSAVAKAFDYLRGFAPDAFLTCIMFSMLGYFNGHSKSTFVMAQGIAQAFLIRLPLAYYMSIQPNASMTAIAVATPASTVFGIGLSLIYYYRMQKNMQKDLTD